MNLQEAILQLGATAEEIRHSLQALNITGYQEDAANCPLAVYLDGQGFDDVQVTDEIVTAQAQDSARLPQVREFVQNFDDGLYPELEED
jgi:hypothetical protein